MPNADDVIRAAGAVLWRPGPDGPEVGLIHRPRYDDWSFPKGKVEPDEHVQLAAVREVAEETGYQVALSRRLPTITYTVSGRPKQVRYWAARARSDKREDTSFAPNDEVDELIWLGPLEARRQLTRWLDVTVLDAFLAMPAETVPILLLRHAAAERRSGRYRQDVLRPLADRGIEQAATIASLLDTHIALAIHSSEAARCVDTVRPYAEAQDRPIGIACALAEDVHPAAAADWLRELIGQGEPAVLCSHKPVLDELLLSVLPSPAAKPDPTTLHRPTVSGRAGSAREYERLRAGRLGTGSAWVLHFTRPSDPRQPPALISVDRLRS
jgi:8-oxo-(d)GTP phosphatase